MEYNNAALVTYDANTQALQVGTSSAGDYCNIGDYWPWWQDYHHYYHYSYPVYIDNKSKIEQAFKIVSKLMEKKIVSKITVEKFVELVNDIAAIL